MASQEKRFCTNPGCGQTYSEDTNDGLSSPCVHHWGQVFFHDAYKGWTCCQQKSTDFTTFLNFKGCRKGKHSDVTRETKKVPEKQEIKETSAEEKRPQNDFIFRPDVWTPVPVKEGKSLQNSVESTDRSEQNPIVFCKKCRQSDPNSKCVYHCGQTIFHDSLKYWTCCPKKKFTDFQDFQELKGCQEAEEHEMEVQVQRPRVDWFQTDDCVTLVLYGLKGVRSLGTEVKTNGKCVKGVFRDKVGNKLFEEEWILKEFVVKGDKSHVLVERTKVEIHLEKAVKQQFWSQLEFK